MKLFQSEDLSALFGDHGLVPGRVPDDLDDSFFHAGKVKKFLLGVAGDGCTHAAAGRGQGHLDGDEAVAAGQRLDVKIIDETEVDDVDGNLGVVTGFESFPDEFFVGGTFGDGAGGSGRGFEAESVGIRGGEAEQTAVGADGERAAERLGDINRGAGGQGDGVAAGDLDGVTIAFEIDGGDRMHTW